MQVVTTTTAQNPPIRWMFVLGVVCVIGVAHGFIMSYLDTRAKVSERMAIGPLTCMPRGKNLEQPVAPKYKESPEQVQTRVENVITNQLAELLRTAQACPIGACKTTELRKYEYNLANYLDQRQKLTRDAEVFYGEAGVSAANAAHGIGDGLDILRDLKARMKVHRVDTSRFQGLDDPRAAYVAKVGWADFKMCKK
jgi:hypothetical protein